MKQKLILNLPKPMPASNDCLPHAAMNLGSARGVGMRPRPGMVSRLVIQPQLDAWCFFRMDDAGGFVGESWHPSKDDALHTARREFGAELIDQLVSLTEEQSVGRDVIPPSSR